MAAQPLPTTLASAVWPSRPDRSAALLRAVLLALAGTALLTLSAKLKVPFYPVPMTMQTLVVLVLGAAFGTRLAMATVALYLVEGALGLPVFADTPERGFGRSLLGMGAAMALGHAVIFAFGFGWLATLYGPSVAWTAGVAPFALATVLKTALGTAMVPALWALLDRRS